MAEYFLLLTVIFDGSLTTQRLLVQMCACLCNLVLFADTSRCVRCIYHIRSYFTLRKHAYFNILIILPPKNENFQIKNSDIFHNSAQNIDCGYSLEPPRRGGSNEYPQSMFLSRNKKANVYSWKPQFYYIKVGFKGVKVI